MDLAGVGGSTGTTPNSVEEMAYNAFAFLDAIELDRYDLLGFSIGGLIAQEMALFRPWQVRRLVLAGTAPRGGRNIHLYTAGAIRDTAFRDAPTPEGLLTLFFEESASSQAKGVEFLKRLGLRTAERGTPSTLAVRDAQLISISAWGGCATTVVACSAWPTSSSPSWSPTETTTRWCPPRTPTCWPSTCPSRS